MREELASVLVAGRRRASGDAYGHRGGAMPAAKKGPEGAAFRANSAESPGGDDTFVLPLVHVKVPEAAVNVGFWGALAGAVALGAVELPLAALIGAGVVVAKHRKPGKPSSTQSPG
jgi:hypothetical protein